MTDFSNYTLGRVVRQKNVDGIRGKITGKDRKKTLVHGMLGHVVGFEVVEYDECYDTIIRVKWSDGQEYGIHPNQLELL